MPQSRQLAAIMFTDIVGYTALMGADEQKAFQLLKKNRQIQQPLIKQYNGTWIKELGDGVLASFHTVTDAVFCAAAIHQTCIDVDGLQLRIGIHLGEVIFEDNDVFGDGVNIASRLQAMASPGSTWVSEAVYKNLVNKKEITSEFIKEETLKNVTEPVKVYEITVKEIPGYIPGNLKGYQNQSSSQKPGRKKTIFFAAALILIGLFATWFLFFKNQTQTGKDKKVNSEKSIAVLPFKLIGNDDEGKYFAEGVADVLINHLHGIEDLKVRSRTSVEQYRDTKKRMADIAKELNVDYIIEGSAQKYKDDIRIIVQLIDPGTDEHIWKNEYNKKFEDILNVQSEIALQIVKELNVALAPEQKQRIKKIYTKNAEAWDLFLKGKEYLRTWSKFHEINDLNIAIRFFSESIKKDTAFALGYTWLADAIQGKDQFTINKKIQVADSAFQLLQKSNRLDPGLPENYKSLAEYYVFSKADHNTGMQYIEKAIGIEPDNQEFWVTKGILLREQIRHLDALASYYEALQKEQSEYYNILLMNIGFSYACVNKFELAEIFIKKALEKEPDNLLFLRSLSHYQMITGKYDEFLNTINNMISIRKDNVGLMDQGKAYLLLNDYTKAEKAYAAFFLLPEEKYFNNTQEKHAYAQVLRKLGKEKEALKYINESKAWIEKNMADPNYDLAKVYSFLGEKQKALDYLSKWKPNWGVHVWVEKDPLFENIRNEPGFKQLVLRFKSEVEILEKEARIKIAKGEFPTIEMIRK